MQRILFRKKWYTMNGELRKSNIDHIRATYRTVLDRLKILELQIAYDRGSPLPVSWTDDGTK